MGTVRGRKYMRLCWTKAFPEHWATACCLPGPRCFPKKPVTAHVPPALAPERGTPELIPLPAPAQAQDTSHCLSAIRPQCVKFKRK